MATRCLNGTHIALQNGFLNFLNQLLNLIFFVLFLFADFSPQALDVGASNFRIMQVEIVDVQITGRQ